MRAIGVCPIVLAAAVQTAVAEPELTADHIIQKAIEVQKQHEDAGNEVKYDYELVSVTEKLDKQGEVKEVEEHLYRSDHIEGVAYERLVEKDGRELTDKEIKRERKREEKFRKKLAKGEAKHNDANDRVAFDEEPCHDTTSNASTYDHSADANATSFGSSRNPASSRSREPSTAPSTKPWDTSGSTPRASRSHASSSSCGKKSGFGGG